MIGGFIYTAIRKVRSVPGDAFHTGTPGVLLDSFKR